MTTIKRTPTHGLSENENAAMRALMLIGADQLGIDLTLVADDLRLTIGARLPAAVCDRLLAMLSQVNHDAAIDLQKKIWTPERVLALSSALPSPEHYLKDYSYKPSYGV